MLRKSFFLTQTQVDFLEGLEGLTVSEHLRRAIDDYIIKKKIETAGAVTSPSKMKIFHHGKEVSSDVA